MTTRQTWNEGAIDVNGLFFAGPATIELALMGAVALLALALPARIRPGKA